MDDTQTRTIGSVTVGKRLAYGKELSIKNIVQEYFNPQAGRMEWRLVYGLCAGYSSGSERFASREEALDMLNDFGPVDTEKETST